mmetsp:Transcript_34829/g.76256  ORF Transcript_34829/g.76256 Transcript_34829/m.76256 type:complete len:211 (-) Transcript_34829:239-871(-)
MGVAILAHPVPRLHHSRDAGIRVRVVGTAPRAPALGGEIMVVAGWAEPIAWLNVLCGPRASSRHGSTHGIALRVRIGPLLALETVHLVGEIVRLTEGAEPVPGLHVGGLGHELGQQLLLLLLLLLLGWLLLLLCRLLHLLEALQHLSKLGKLPSPWIHRSHHGLELHGVERGGRRSGEGVGLGRVCWGVGMLIVSGVPAVGVGPVGPLRA